MRALRGKDGLLVYLDFDGVLHHENVRRHPRRGVYLVAPQGFRLFQHAGLLEALLAPYPPIQVVLSTSWVQVLSYSRAVKRLPPALQRRVIGATYHSAMNADAFAVLPRGVQVLDDVERRQPRGWIALDDDGAGWPNALRDHLVLTDERDGLSPHAIQEEIRNKLAAMCEGVASHFQHAGR